MRVSDFDFMLPEELIAQVPVEPRDMSRLMVVPKDGSPLQHRTFHDIVEYFEPGDVLVVNDTRVLPARLFGRPSDGGGGSATVEVLLLREVSLDIWECLVKPGRKFKVGSTFEFGDGLLTGEVVGITEGGERHLRLSSPAGVREAIHRLGTMPLPPYIRESISDPERYQTVYAKDEGSAAAPTAGLHFTGDLLDRIREMGVKVVSVTLHVGIGTFRPVKVEEITEHRMHSEYYAIPTETAEVINSGKRVICVGTTSVRTLESCAGKDGRVVSGSGWTDIFIYPGYRFKIVDGMITNFHLPKSTLLMLVSAFAGKERVLGAYGTAVNEGYRFFSFGDAMLLI